MHVETLHPIIPQPQEGSTVPTLLLDSAYWERYQQIKNGVAPLLSTVDVSFEVEPLQQIADQLIFYGSIVNGIIRLELCLAGLAIYALLERINIKRYEVVAQPATYPLVYGVSRFGQEGYEIEPVD